MPALAADSFPMSPTDAYRRQARRIRCHYAGQPAMLQLALKTLAAANAPRRAHHSESATKPPRPSPAAVVAHTSQSTSATSGSARQFADYLAARAPQTVLRYSERLEMLKAARRFGIDRFEANLLIATVLERHRRASMIAENEPTARRGSSLLANVAVFLMVQGAVVLSAWWTLVR